MAIVEDEVRNDSEEENEIEVVVEEDDAEPDSDDSDVCTPVRSNIWHNNYFFFYLFCTIYALHIAK